MTIRVWKNRQMFIWLGLLLVVALTPKAKAQTPSITGLSPTSGPVGIGVAITGSGFGATQGGSTLSLGTTSPVVTYWSDTSIVAIVPSGAVSGSFTVTVSGQGANSTSFTVTPLPSGWSDGDVGSVGTAGSATYANGTFTVKGAGADISGTADAFHFAYQALSGDGTIIARVASLSGGGTYAKAGAMIRETLTSGSKHAYTAKQESGAGLLFEYRATTSGSTTQTFGSGGPWMKVVRSGNSLSGYISADGVNWAQQGSTQTISMATSVYIGLGVTGYSTTSLATATFDNVSVSTTSSPAPLISSLSATTGSVGSQVVIYGSGFGTTQSGSAVLLNGSFVTVNSWSSTSITITIPSGATTGYFVVALAPSLNDSNVEYFTVTSQPLPATWLDSDVGTVGSIGSATYANGTFTVKGAGADISGTADAFHFAYQALSGDGTIIARVVSLSGGGTYAKAGVMIRETLTPGSANAYTAKQESGAGLLFEYRATTSGSTTQTFGSGGPWMKLVRSGNSLSGYISADGVNWAQQGSTQTITMATNIYIGLAVTGYSTTSLATATFDNVSISTTSSPAPLISSISATTGSVGDQVAISGSGFGSAQGNGTVYLNGSPVTIDSWSSTSITITIPSGATTGYLMAAVSPNLNDSNAVYFTVTSQPLPATWLDSDVGAVGSIGSATYSSGTFTVKGAGSQISSTVDSFHFAYQVLSGDGSIIARVASASSVQDAGVMIRETLNSNSKNVFVGYQNTPRMIFQYRASTGGTTSLSASGSVTLPYWVKLVRSGSTFTGYISSNGTSWTQLGTSQTISMAQNVCVGLAVESGNTSTLGTATFDNVTTTGGVPLPTPVITSLSPTTGGPGNSVTIGGYYFGATQGSGNVYFNGVAATSITSWSDGQIVASVPRAASTGPVTVVASSLTSNTNFTFTFYDPVITSVNPPAAPIGGQVTINGSGFGSSQGTSTVQFNSIFASVTSWSDTSVTVTLPPSAVSGTVTLTEQGATSSASFTVLEGLTISGISPTTGPIGASVTVTGSGFGATQANSTVAFDTIPATAITSWTDTQIVAVVPLGASPGPVSVTVASLNAQGPTFALFSKALLTDSLGNSTSYQGAPSGGQWHPTLSQGSGCSSCTVRGNIQYQYDNFGNVTSMTDSLGNVTTYTYDSSNNQLSQTVPVTLHDQRHHFLHLQ